MNTSCQISKIQSPDVSVVIPTHNRLSMLEKALASVFAQEFDGTIEIIVIDDNSQDGTSEVVSQKYPDVCLITLKENVGAYVTRNRGVLEAKGKYIAFLDSDDIWETNYLKTQVAALEGKEQCFSVSAITIWYKNESRKFIFFQKPNLERYTSSIHELLVRFSFIRTLSSVIFPRSVFDEIGLFDETFRVGADRELYLRCLIAGYCPIFTEQPLAVWQKHEDQLTQVDASKIELRKDTRIAYLERYFDTLNQQFYIPPIRRLYAEIYSSSARDYYSNRLFRRWIISSIHLAKYSSIKYALLNMMRDVLRPTKKYIPSHVLNTIKHRFLFDSFST